MARGGIEPPTPAFQGCLPTRLSGSESRQVTLGERLTRDHLWDHFGSFRPFSPLQCSRIVPRSGAVFRRSTCAEVLMRAAIYAGVSTTDQKCEMQLTELREYVARRGINEQDEEVAHPGNSISTSRTTAFRRIWQFAMDRLPPDSGWMKLTGPPNVAMSTSLYRGSLLSASFRPCAAS